LELKSDILSENIELKQQNELLGRQLRTSLEQLKEFSGLDREYSSVINDLERQLNTMNDSLTHKDQVINVLMHKMKTMIYDYTKQSEKSGTEHGNEIHQGSISPMPQLTVTAADHSHQHGTTTPMPQLTVTEADHTHNINNIIMDTQEATTEIRTSLEVNIDTDVELNISMDADPELDRDIDSNEFITENKQNDLTISMESENDEDDQKVAIVARKQYQIRNAELSYITQTPSRTMSERSVWEENSLEKAPSNLESGTGFPSTKSQSQEQMETQLRAYVMKENEWFFQKKDMEQQISALNDELKAVQTELHGFKAYDYSDKQHDMIMGILTNYKK